MDISDGCLLIAAIVSKTHDDTSLIMSMRRLKYV